jgi:hypothetical protein
LYLKFDKRYLRYFYDILIALKMSNDDNEVTFKHRGFEVRVSQITLHALEEAKRILNSEAQSDKRPLVPVSVLITRGHDGNVTAQVHRLANGFFHI